MLLIHCEGGLACAGQRVTLSETLQSMTGRWHRQLNTCICFPPLTGLGQRLIPAEFLTVSCKLPGRYTTFSVKFRCLRFREARRISNYERYRLAAT